MADATRLREWSARRSSWVVVFAVVAAAYALGAELSWSSLGADGPGFAFFPPAGVTLAALVLLPKRRWSAVLAAVAVAELVIDLRHGLDLDVAALYVGANLVEPVVGALAFERLTAGRCDVATRRDFGAFLLGACLAGPAVGGLIGAATVTATKDGTFVVNWLHWLAGDGVAVLALAPPVILGVRHPEAWRHRRAELVVTTAAMTALTALAFTTVVPPGLLTLPLLAWAAFRLGPFGVGMLGAVFALVANYLTAAGEGPFANLDLSESSTLATLQLYVAVLLVVAYLAALEVRERLGADRRAAANARAASLQRLAAELGTAIDPDDLRRVLARHLPAAFDSSALMLGFVDPARGVITMVVAEGIPVAVRARFEDLPIDDETTASAVAVRTGRRFLFEDAREHGARYPWAAVLVDELGARSSLVWPVRPGDAGEPIGVLNLFWRAPQSFDPEQLQFVETVCHLVGQAASRTNQFADEHTVATILQRAVVPRTGEVEGFDVSGWYRPAVRREAVGGDWFDALALREGRTLLCVGDVVGHGLAAIGDMTQLRNAARMLAVEGHAPDRILEALSVLVATATDGRFATVVVGVFDATSRVLSYGWAGHPAPILRRAGGDEAVFLDAAGGPPLGATEAPSYRSRSVSLHDGDLLVMYTDGLVERRDDSIVAGMERLRDAVAGWQGSELDDLCEHAGARSLAGTEPLDDACMLAARVRRGPPDCDGPARS